MIADITSSVSRWATNSLYGAFRPEQRANNHAYKVPRCSIIQRLVCPMVSMIHGHIYLIFLKIKFEISCIQWNYLLSVIIIIIIIIIFIIIEREREREGGIGDLE